MRIRWQDPVGNKAGGDVLGRQCDVSAGGHRGVLDGGGHGVGNGVPHGTDLDGDGPGARHPDGQGPDDGRGFRGHGEGRAGVQRRAGNLSLDGVGNDVGCQGHPDGRAAAAGDSDGQGIDGGGVFRRQGDGAGRVDIRAGGNDRLGRVGNDVTRERNQYRGRARGGHPAGKCHDIGIGQSGQAQGAPAGDGGPGNLSGDGVCYDVRPDDRADRIAARRGDAEGQGADRGIVGCRKPYLIRSPDIRAGGDQGFCLVGDHVAEAGGLDRQVSGASHAHGNSEDPGLGIGCEEHVRIGVHDSSVSVHARADRGTRNICCDRVRNHIAHQGHADGLLPAPGNTHIDGQDACPQIDGRVFQVLIQCILLLIGNHPIRKHGWCFILGGEGHIPDGRDRGPGGDCGPRRVDHHIALSGYRHRVFTGT